MTTLPETKDLILEPQGSVLTIWLNRPQAKNALSAAMVDELSTVLDATRDDRNLRTIVLRGKEGFFCAGGDIKGFKSGLQGGEPTEEDVARGNRTFGNLMIKLNEQPQTVIILVEGAAIGGGLGLACVGDVTIVTREAKFRLSETSLGIPPAQIAPFVTERVGLTQARRLMLTGARFKGEEAVQYGIGHILAEDTADMEAKCAEVLKQIAYIGGVDAAPIDSPRGNLTGDPYFTDGYRVVLWVSEEPVAIDDIKYLEWVDMGRGQR